jgi:CheY-like chemotaxis protein
MPQGIVTEVNRPTRAREAAMGLEGVRVLIVEDDSLVAMSVGDMLSDLGCSVVANPGNLTQAFEMVGAGGFDFALLDINLRGKEVFPVAEVLSRQGIPFAFASGYGRAGLPEEFRTRPVLSKPFQISELSTVLSSALAEQA